MQTEQLLLERATQYGDFSDLARLARQFKNVMTNSSNWNGLNPMQQEALDMIVHKIARILNGDPNLEDSWNDIAGYAKLPLKYKENKQLYTLGNDLPEYLQGISDIL